MKKIGNTASTAWQAGFAAGQSNKGNKAKKADVQSPYAKILSELINKQKKELEEAIKSGQTMQQRALGISDEEWQRLQLEDSPLTKTEAEREKEAKAEKHTGRQNGDIETIRHVMGDGSILIIESQNGKIISQQRKKPHMITVANPAYIPPEKGGQPSLSNARTKLVPYNPILELL